MFGLVIPILELSPNIIKKREQEQLKTTWRKQSHEDSARETAFYSSARIWKQESSIKETLSRENIFLVSPQNWKKKNMKVKCLRK